MSRSSGSLRKRSKEIKGFIIGIIFTVALTGTIAMANPVTREIVFGVGVSFNGSPVSFDAGMEPFIMDGRTFLPVRAIADLVGLDVGFEDGVVHLSTGGGAIPAPVPTPAPLPTADPTPVTGGTESEREVQQTVDQYMTEIQRMFNTGIVDTMNGGEFDFSNMRNFFLASDWEAGHGELVEVYGLLTETLQEIQDILVFYGAMLGMSRQQVEADPLYRAESWANAFRIEWVITEVNVYDNRASVYFTVSMEFDTSVFAQTAFTDLIEAMDDEMDSITNQNRLMLLERHDGRWIIVSDLDV